MLKQLQAHPNCRLFRIDSSRSDDFTQWDLEPCPNARTIPAVEGFWLVEAIAVPESDSEKYYLDLSLVERFNDCVYILKGTDLKQMYTHELKKDVIPSLACEEFGVYDLYFSRTDSSVGRRVLEEGLKHATRKAASAQDLGYICRDEGLSRHRAFRPSLFSRSEKSSRTLEPASPQDLGATRTPSSSVSREQI